MQVEIFKSYLQALQKKSCERLSRLEPKKEFSFDNWERAQGGGGLTSILQGGDVFDSAGVNYSYVHGAALPASATLHRPELAGRHFEAMGVSSVIHPKNPFAPTAHLNVRLFVAHKEGEQSIWWFGGGFDLTPYYPFEEDCIAWHLHAKSICDPYGLHVFPKYKQWADDYFFLPHRQEHRGVGGLFFDDLNKSVWGWDWQQCLDFTQKVGLGFLDAYIPILEKRIMTPYEQRHLDFQSYRRGRYVEFNLVYDRGTLFGLQSGGRTESILMSLPPNVSWQYGFFPKEDSQELHIYKYLKPRDWAQLKVS